MYERRGCGGQAPGLWAHQVDGGMCCVEVIEVATTIAAISTPLGEGAIGIVRLSGTDSFAIAQKIFKGKDLSQVASHTLNYG